MVSVLFLSLGTAGRKRLTDKFPHMGVAVVPLRELRELLICVPEAEEPNIRKIQILLQQTRVG